MKLLRLLFFILWSCGGILMYHNYGYSCMLLYYLGSFFYGLYWMFRE